MSWLNVLAPVGVGVALFAALKPRVFAIIIKTLPRDLHIIWIFLKVHTYQLLVLYNSTTVSQKFRKTARENSKKIAIYFEEEKWTFEQIDILSNKIGNHFKSIGFKRGDSVALMLDNRPEFVCIWLGLAKIGVVTALINTNIIAKDVLVHAIKTGKSNAIIFGSRFKKVVENVQEVMPELKLFQFNDQHTEVLAPAINLKSKLEHMADYPLDSDIDAGKGDDTLMYIYTSGTTGLPKASVIKNSRFLLEFTVVNCTGNITKEDVIYIPAPLYHTLGGVMGMSQCLVGGSSAVIRTKFSASNFWKDCEKYNCTISFYIGELAKYIILAHQNSKEKPTYKLQKMFGNGMKPTTWKQFIENFNVGQIFECYGSTEGNFALFNLDNTVGAVGYVPIYADPFIPLALIKCNESGEPIRNNNGLCELCEYNEPGLLVIRIWRFLPSTTFEGYTDKQATQKKILENVLRNGDTYFNTGDVLVRDDHGYFFFKDRTGDTFRWKGENVSTNEIEDFLGSHLDRDVAVYGVEIPGTDGKAGMVAIVDTDNSIDFTKFLQDCKTNLPSYSIPIFVRLVDNIPQTGTFKIQKVHLQKEGFDINVVKDKLYFLDPRKKEYILLNDDIYDEIVNCKLRI